MFDIAIMDIYFSFNKHGVPLLAKTNTPFNFLNDKTKFHCILFLFLFKIIL